MSLLPMLFSNWWEELERPHHLLDQHFGLALRPEDLPTSLSPLDDDIVVIRPRRRTLQRYQPYDRSLSRRTPGVSTVGSDKDKFQATLDVQQFKPEEVTVKTVDKEVVVECKHEERQDEHGWISRQFVRKYHVPEQCDIEELKSTLSSDGILSITAPRIQPASEDKKERIIQIKATGQPALRERLERPVEKQIEQPQRNPAPEGAQDKTVKAA